MEADYKKLARDNVSRRKEMIFLKSEGKTYKKIAQIFGVTKQRVHQIIKKEEALRKAMERDDFQCRVCASREYVRPRFKDKNNTNIKMSNLICLCENCQRKALAKSSRRNRE